MCPYPLMENSSIMDGFYYSPLWRNKIIYCKMMHIPLLRGNTNNEAFRGGAFSRGEIRVHLASEQHVIEN